MTGSRPPMVSAARLGRAGLPKGLILLILAVGAGCAAHMNRVELATRILSGDMPLIVDVRSDAEYEAGHVPCARHVPFYSVLSRSDEIRPTGGSNEVVLYCEHGPRAALASLLLRLRSYGSVLLLDGHMRAWAGAAFPWSGEIGASMGKADAFGCHGDERGCSFWPIPVPWGSPRSNA